MNQHLATVVASDCVGWLAICKTVAPNDQTNAANQADKQHIVRQSWSFGGANHLVLNPLCRTIPRTPGLGAGAAQHASKRCSHDAGDLIVYSFCLQTHSAAIEVPHGAATMWEPQSLGLSRQALGI